jgi:transmembrane secretion effector
VGMVGLAQFVPLFLLALIAGATADRSDRRSIMLWCTGVEIACVLALAAMSLRPSPNLLPIFVIAAVFGASRAFLSPAGEPWGQWSAHGSAGFSARCRRRWLTTDRRTLRGRALRASFHAGNLSINPVRASNRFARDWPPRPYRSCTHPRKACRPSSIGACSRSTLPQRSRTRNARGPASRAKTVTTPSERWKMWKDGPLVFDAF